MLESAYSMRKSLDAMFNDLLSAEAWNIVKEEVDFLVPFKYAIEYLESDKKPTTPAIIPLFERLHIKLKNRLDDVGKQMLKKFEKFWPSEYLEEYQLHAFLHPGCRGYVFSEHDRAQGLDHLSCSTSSTHMRLNQSLPLLAFLRC